MKESRAKLRTHLLTNLGRVVDSKELTKMFGTACNWRRHISALSAEEGLQILTSDDRADLKPGQYLMVDPRPTTVSRPGISKEVRTFVLRRSGFACQMCGAASGETNPYYPSRKLRLHVGHIVERSVGGGNEPDNLRAICSLCRDGARRLAFDHPSSSRILTQLRRATGAEQIEVLKWLIQKHPERAMGLASQG